MRSFDQCCEEIRKDPLIPLEEKCSKITFKNESRKNIRVIRIDDCVIKEGLRCDYLVIPENGIEHYVELKGSDVSHAVKQLKCTITEVSEDARHGKKCCFIVSSRCPKTSAEIQNIQSKLKKEFNSTLTVKNIKYEHSL
jgi:hypothetical protein